MYPLYLVIQYLTQLAGLRQFIHTLVKGTLGSNGGYRKLSLAPNQVFLHVEQNQFESVLDINSSQIKSSSNRHFFNTDLNILPIIGQTFSSQT